MQNQNIHPWPWGQGAAPPFPSGQPLVPTSFPPPGLDQTSLLSGYQQMYGNPPVQNPPDYGQWTAAQLQQWQQWQQWQEKYQQWQAQYGKKYAESLAAFGQSPNLLMPGLPPVMGVPKPVEPASPLASIAYPPLPPNTQPVPPPPPDEEKPPLPANSAFDSNESSKNEYQLAQDNPEELSEAEKTFDIQFKQWEGQFNEWKKQNQDHPDKAQYKEYEKKWETWREQLLQRREQMRKKRLNKTSEQQNEVDSAGKVDDSAAKQGIATGASISLKPSNSKYNYKVQPTTASQASFTNDPPKIENVAKSFFFEKPLATSQPNILNPSNVNQIGKEYHSNQDINPKKIDYPSNFSNFMGEKSETNKMTQFSNHNFNRNQGLLITQKGQFDNGQDFNFNQNGNPRFRNFQESPNNGNVNLRLRNSNFDSPRFEGNFENFPIRLRSSNEPRNFGYSPRFSENFKNDIDLSQQRLLDNRDRDAGSQNFNKNNFEMSGKNSDLNDFRPVNFPPEAQNRVGGLTSKPKVPSLFDITVEKPPSLVSTSDRNPKVWEKFDKKDYFEDAFDKRPEDKKSDRNEKTWGNNIAWTKNVPSPWMQPWELEKIASQNPRPYDREISKNNGPWMTDILGKQEIDKVELSGYVGSILAKLGNFNVVPPSITKSEASQDENISPNLFDGNNLQSEANRRMNWNDSTSTKNSDELQDLQENCKLSNNEDPNFRTPNLATKNFTFPVAKDFDERDNNFNDRLRDNSFAPKNFDRLEESKKDFEEKPGLVNDSKSFDIDERISIREDRLSFRREEKFSFNKDDSRNYGRFGFREDRRNFTNDDRFFGKDDKAFCRSGRDDRNYGRYNARDDTDDRFNNRNGKRGFDRFDRDDRFFDRHNSSGMEGFFDRFGRNRDHSMNELIWNPQVFEYSQGRHQNFSDSDRDSGFKISTIVDYSHGENKQTFDYGHGENAKEKQEMKSFDYGHKAEAPCIIDYGHGVDREAIPKDIRRDKSRDEDLSNNDGLKIINSETLSPSIRSKSPRGFHRSRSRSPHPRFKRGSKSPTFKSHRSRSRDRLGRPIFRRDRNDSEGKLSPGDSEVSKHSFDVTTVLVEDLICLPGREARPNKLVFIMRGIPGSGKTYVTKLIKDKEVELGGDPPRILSLDDYFMTEVEKEIVDKETGRKVKNKVLEYEYEAGVEPHYRGSLLKAFKKTVSDGFFSFIIVDSVNEKIKDFEEMWSFAKQKGFQVYIAEMDNDVTTCKTRNIHKRTEKEIFDLASAWEETPSHFLRLDVRSLLQSDAITEVEMEVVSDTELDKTIDKEEEKEKNSEENENREKLEDEEEDEPGVSAFATSRWDQIENSEQNLDRLDGLKRRREGFHATMEDYLQLPDDFDLQVTSDSAPGKKKVRWADLEEKRQQEKMRAIGFVVGQTDWSRMTDPTFGESALTRTKYI